MLPLELMEDHLQLLDQRRLPAEVKYLQIFDHKALVEAVRELAVRGAPALGAAGAFGVWLASREALSLPEDRQRDFLAEALRRIASARPTAVNLSRGVERVAARLRYPLNNEVLEGLRQEGEALVAEDQRAARRMISLGTELIRDGGVYLTHCNTGGLATTGLGTALGVFFEAKRQNKKFRVFVDETRPLLQGSRLTMTELLAEDIPAVLITDSMAAAVMKEKGVDGVFVGADRIAANGDAANKVGTLQLAVTARFFRVPFYVVAPESTLDPALASGKEIKIEERSAREIKYLDGIQLAPETAEVFNPAFDVTPGSLITAVITEHGIFREPYNFGADR